MTAPARAAGRTGLVGTVFALLGCLGSPAVGATWILQPRSLLPILVLAVALGLWSRVVVFRRSGEPLPLVVGLVGGAAAIGTGIVRAITDQYAYFLGYPGLALFVLSFVMSSAWHPLFAQSRRLHG